jgi:hypothetical protein
VDERFGEERARGAVLASNLGEDGREEWFGFGDVAVELDRESMPNVARDDEDDELQRFDSLVEQHDVRIVRENHGGLAHRTAARSHEVHDAAICRRRRHVVHVRDHRVANASQSGVGHVGVRRAEGRIPPIVPKEVLDAAETVAPSHHVARDLADFERRVQRLAKRIRLQPRGLLDERRDHLARQRVFRLLRQLPIGDLGVVLKSPLGHRALRARGVPRLIRERGAHHEREDQKGDRADQTGGATHTSIHTI